MAQSDSPFVRDEQGGFWGRLRPLGTIRTYPAGATVYQQGELSDHFYYLISGRVKIAIGRPDGSEKIIAIMEPGTTFGDSACFDGLPYYASAVALRPAQVCVVSREAAFAAAQHDMQIMQELLKGLIRKQRLLAMQVEAMAFLKVPARIALILARLASDYGRPLPGGRGKRLTLRLTHEELASVIGTSRVTVSKVIGDLLRAGILEKHKWDLIVVDEERLWQMALPR